MKENRKEQIDIIIPAYRPDDNFKELLERLRKQTVPPSHIYVLQTLENDDAECLVLSGEDISVHPIKKSEFDHGGTRRLGASMSRADYFVCMTQDAMPKDNHLLENLLKAFQVDEKAGVSYARQLARKEAGVLERLTRDYNYPAKDQVKTKEDLTRLGIKTYFCSDVCAMYKKDLYESLGGFVEKTIFNEDMIMASKIIGAGYHVVYCAKARVVHSHSYTCMQQFHRNFDLGVSQKQYEEVFKSISSEKEGAGYAKKTILTLMKKGKPCSAFYFALQCGFKLFGYKFGVHYDKLPEGFVRFCTMNKGYWK